MEAHLGIVPHRRVGPIDLGMKGEDVRVAMIAIGLELAISRDSLDYFGKENAI